MPWKTHDIQLVQDITLGRTPVKQAPILPATASRGWYLPNLLNVRLPLSPACISKLRGTLPHLSHFAPYTGTGTCLYLLLIPFVITRWLSLGQAQASAYAEVGITPNLDNPAHPQMLLGPPPSSVAREVRVVTGQADLDLELANAACLFGLANLQSGHRQPSALYNLLVLRHCSLLHEIAPVAMMT